MKTASPDIYDSLMQLKNLGDPEILSATYAALGKYPENANLWHLASELESEANLAAKSLESIELAIKLSPSNAKFYLHKAMVLIQSVKLHEVPVTINQAFKAASDKAVILGFAKEGIACEMFSKLELSNELLAAILLSQS